jgi:hypothetical protein
VGSNSFVIAVNARRLGWAPKALRHGAPSVADEQRAIIACLLLLAACSDSPTWVLAG